MTGNVIQTDFLIVGQGLAGSCLAWALHEAGRSIVIVDRAEQSTASAVAAGLITPVTGRRMTTLPNFDQLMEAARLLYRRIEQQTQQRLFDESPSRRDFVDDAERQFFLNERLPQLNKIVRLRMAADQQVAGFRMPSAARLHVRQLIHATRQFFTTRNQYLVGDLPAGSHPTVTADGIIAEVPGSSGKSTAISASAIIMCRGYAEAAQGLFADIPGSPARGDVLRVRIPGFSHEEIVHQGVWIVPEPRGEFLVGATYDSGNADPKPSTAGRRILLERLQSVTPLPVTMVEHLAGVRATTIRRRVIAGRHPQYRDVCILNGLGSRGALLAPFAARAIATMLELNADGLNERDRTLIDSPVAAMQPEQPNASGMTPGMPVRGGRSVTQMAATIVRRTVRPGEFAIDATAGNGYDTVLLAKLVCNHPDSVSTEHSVSTESGNALVPPISGRGNVMAMDVQRQAIDSTALRLQQNDLPLDSDLVSIHLLNRCHSEMTTAVEQHWGRGTQVAAVMFNLGYLPGSDKSTTTRVESTCLAIRSATSLLRKAGVVTVAVYRGHVGGAEEYAAVARLCGSLPVTEFRTDEIVGDPGNASGPVLFVIRRNNSIPADV